MSKPYAALIVIFCNFKFLVLNYIYFSFNKFVILDSIKYIRYFSMSIKRFTFAYENNQ